MIVYVCAWAAWLNAKDRHSEPLSQPMHVYIYSKKYPACMRHADPRGPLQGCNRGKEAITVSHVLAYKSIKKGHTGLTVIYIILSVSTSCSFVYAYD